MPHPRYRIYTHFNNYWWFFKDLLLGRFKKGDEVEKLERKLEEQFNVANALCIPMTRVGVYLILKKIIKPGQEVILSPYTIADVINMVICAGGIPVFCDIDQKTTNINPDKIEELINQKTGAVLVTHLHGIAAPAHQIAEICRRHNLKMIEDAAQSFGGYEKGKRLGTIGDIGIFSFGMYKNINSWYGGAIVSKDRELISQIRNDLNQFKYQSPLFIFKKILKGLANDLATHPLIFQALTYWVFRFGYLHDIAWINKKVEIELDLELKKEIPLSYLSKFTPFQARLVLSQIDNIDQETDERIKKASLYREGLKEIPELVLPIEENASKFIYPVFALQYKERKNLLKYMMKHRRDVAAQHLKNCADLPAFKEFYRDCPVARKTASEVILLPSYIKYPIKEVKKNIEVIRRYFKK